MDLLINHPHHHLLEQQKKVHQADMRGDRRTLVADSFIPAIMAVIYLLLVLYFKAKGGYKPVQI